MPINEGSKKMTQLGQKPGKSDCKVWVLSTAGFFLDLSILLHKVGSLGHWKTPGVAGLGAMRQASNT